MSKTAQLNVNSSTYTAVVTATSDSRRVTVYEDDQAGTTDYYVSSSGSDSDKVTKPAGSKKDFLGSKPFGYGTTVGYVKTQTGSVTFSIEEEGA